MNKKNIQSFSIVIPAFNEAATLPRVLDTALKTNANEVIIVDDGSSDTTLSILQSYAEKNPQVIVVHHEKNQGVGAARRSGFNASREDIVVFIDADVTTFTSLVIESIVAPVLSGKADFSIAAFENEGRVTELTVRPLLTVCFPQLASLKQPISGQLAIRRQYIFSKNIDDGILGILIDAYLAGARIEEVNIGKLIHSHRPLSVKQSQAIVECRACLNRFLKQRDWVKEYLVPSHEKDEKVLANLDDGYVF